MDDLAFRHLLQKKSPCSCNTVLRQALIKQLRMQAIKTGSQDSALRASCFSPAACQECTKRALWGVLYACAASCRTVVEKAKVLAKALANEPVDRYDAEWADDRLLACAALAYCKLAKLTTTCPTEGTCSATSISTPSLSWRAPQEECWLPSLSLPVR
eukprot:1433123-Amphidinium_carterae.1